MFSSFWIKNRKISPRTHRTAKLLFRALDRDVKKENENPSIGILLCKDKDDTVVEYALSRTLSPSLVSQYKTNLPNKKILQKKFEELLD